MKLEIKDRYLHPVSTEVGFTGTSNKDMNIAVFEPDDGSMPSERYAKIIVDRWNAFEEGGILWEVLEILESNGYNYTANEIKKLLGE